jgi:hypothetical protein
MSWQNPTSKVSGRSAKIERFGRANLSGEKWLESLSIGRSSDFCRSRFQKFNLESTMS